MDSQSDLEQVAQISLKIFNSLPKTGKPNSNEWTVLSCIVKEENCKFEAIALGTGSKCIGKSKMSSKGDILNDSHAEIICRRAFLLYLFDQISNCLKNDQSVFKFDATLSKFSLKEVKFHFFTTLIPCGDASIFPKNSLSDLSVGDLVISESSKAKSGVKRSSNSKDSVRKKLMHNSEDIFRTGAKCLIGDDRQDSHEEGAGYHITGVVRTKPGRGDPTLSVSCTDKMTKWCHLGIQGAILSLLLKEPIYLVSLVVAKNSPYSEDSLKRAFHQRLHNVQMVSPFKSTLPICYQSKDAEFGFQKDEHKDACPSSIIWFSSKNCKGKTIEVAIDGKKQGVTKKTRI
ncbi:hypothetical protein HHI36_018603 [Cryptolaemus montrouzieri]|uniref:tRNA-specific adenosine deaminase 1 n=1 Tax=Cryptolaemus montrouzieri TaxID=559131 RepID=A0ABD2P0M8_9CUCU